MEFADSFKYGEVTYAISAHSNQAYLSASSGIGSNIIFSLNHSGIHRYRFTQEAITEIEHDNAALPKVSNELGSPVETITHKKTASLDLYLARFDEDSGNFYVVDMEGDKKESLFLIGISTKRRQLFRCSDARHIEARNIDYEKVTYGYATRLVD